MLQTYEIYQKFYNKMSILKKLEKIIHAQLYDTIFVQYVFNKDYGDIKWNSNLILRKTELGIQYQLCYSTRLKLVALH